MCGIVGYIGKDDALINLKSKIKLLEYRGYDSSGLCLIDSKTNNFYIKKTVGTIDNIKDLKKIESSVGISHTRWATHGKINEKNVLAAKSCFSDRQTMDSATQCACLCVCAA